MKKLALLLALLLVGCTAPAEEASYREISMADAVVLMEEESGYILLDVRTAEEFAAGHIPGAVNIPNEDIGTQEIEQLPDKAQRLLVYCRSGNRSKQAAKKLAALGYTDVVEIGGINAYDGEIVSETE